MSSVGTSGKKVNPLENAYYDSQVKNQKFNSSAKLNKRRSLKMLKNLKLEEDPQVIKPNFSTLNHHLNKLHNVIVKYDKKSKN